jgi:hypothetical protein
LSISQTITLHNFLKIGWYVSFSRSTIIILSIFVWHLYNHNTHKIMSLHSRLAFSTMRFCFALMSWMLAGREWSAMSLNWTKWKQNLSLQNIDIYPRRLQICREDIWEILYFICYTLLGHLWWINFCEL